MFLIIRLLSITPFEGLKRADQIVEIPLFGVNKSLNVMISLAIVMWKILEK